MRLTKSQERLLAFGFGVIFLIAMLLIALLSSEPTPFQFLVYKIVLAISLAGIAAVVPGFISVEINNMVRAGGAIAVFVIVFFFNPAALVTTPTKPRFTQSEQEVRTQYARIIQLRSDLEALSSYPSKATKLQDMAPKLAKRMLLIKDGDLDPTHQVIKYQYAGLADLVSAHVSKSANRRINHADNCIDSINKALSIFESLRSLPSRTEDQSKALTWLINDSTEDRLNYWFAIALAIKKLDGQSIEIQQIQQRINAISESYLNTHPLKKDPILNKVLQL